MLLFWTPTVFTQEWMTWHLSTGKTVMMAIHSLTLRCVTFNIGVADEKQLLSRDGKTLSRHVWRIFIPNQKILILVVESIKKLIQDTLNYNCIHRIQHVSAMLTAFQLWSLNSINIASWPLAHGLLASCSWYSQSQSERSDSFIFIGTIVCLLKQSKLLDEYVQRTSNQIVSMAKVVIEHMILLLQAVFL